MSEFITGLNAADAGKLSRDVNPSTISNARAVINAAHLPWNVTDVTIRHEFGPDYAVAELTGTQAGSSLHIYLPLNHIGGKWYVAAGQSTPNPLPGAGPTAATTH